MFFAPLAHALRLANKSPSHIPLAFFKLILLCCISVGLFVMLSFLRAVTAPSWNSLSQPPASF